ncbi:MAG: hypothetical protein WCE54_14150 [Ignavibacteriaceae bacterium]
MKIIITLLFLTNLVFAQDNYKKSAEYEKLAVKNYLSKNYSLFLANMKKADKLRPDHPRIIYNLAAAYSLNNDKNNALAELKKLIDMKLYYPVEKDSDFAACRNDYDFNNIIKGFNTNLVPAGSSKTAFTYPEKDLITESVAYDSVKKKFYLSSIHRRKIVCIDENGNTGNFKSEGEDGLWAVFGIKIDPARRILWACTGAIKQMKNYNKKEQDKAAVFKYNIDSEKLIKKYELSDTEHEHLFGDLALSSKGDVYISDSRFNAVYKLSVDSDSLEMFLKPGEFLSLQGLDLSSDEKYLFLADYGLGLYKIELGTKNIKHIKPASGFTPLGTDGLYFYKNSLIATQNGINPQRVVRIYLNENFDRVEKYSILDSNNPYFDEITLGVIDGNNFYFIANSQWGSFDKQGKIFPVEKLKEPRILKITLD